MPPAASGGVLGPGGDWQVLRVLWGTRAAVGGAGLPCSYPGSIVRGSRVLLLSGLCSSRPMDPPWAGLT